MHPPLGHCRAHSEHLRNVFTVIVVRQLAYLKLVFISDTFVGIDKLGELLVIAAFTKVAKASGNFMTVQALVPAHQPSWGLQWSHWALAISTLVPTDATPRRHVMRVHQNTFKASIQYKFISLFNYLGAPFFIIPVHLKR